MLFSAPRANKLPTMLAVDVDLFDDVEGGIDLSPVNIEITSQPPPAAMVTFYGPPIIIKTFILIIT